MGWRVFDAEAFASMEKEARELTRRLKGQELVSTRLLNELFVVASVLRNEAPWFKSERARLGDR